jgi:hypothetical protein
LIELLVVIVGSELLFGVDANVTGTLNVIEGLSLNVHVAVGCQPADCNDGNACTNDTCVNGTYTHTPVACDTGFFCSAKVCDPLLGCVFDHECFGSNGNPCPNQATCDENANTCGGCNPSTAVGIGCRYLSVTPADQGSTPIALKVIGECHDPQSACVLQYVQSKCNGGLRNGEDCLTDDDLSFGCPTTCASGINPGDPCTTNADCILGRCAGTCEAGTLGSTPFYKTAIQWGTAKVRGAQIRPGTDYLVETQCDFPGVVLSVATTARTWKWGDIDGDGDVDALDIAQIVDAFKARVGSVPWDQANIWGCTPDTFLDALDITEDVDAFKGIAFPCDITAPPVDAPLQTLVDALSDIEEALAETVTGACGHLEVNVPTPSACGADMEATSYAVLYENGELVSSGNVTITAHPTQGTADLVVQFTEGGFRSWTLTQTVRLESGVVRLWGTVERIQSLQDPTIRSGGWSYSAEGGAQQDPSSEPGFHDDADLMFGCAAGGAASAQSLLSDLLSAVANVVQMGINYLLDLTIPYTPPTSCTGLAIQDASGQSCATANVPCKNDLDDMCKKVGNIPGVSVGFKKCMKGRCGCGGSHFKKSVITCDDSQSCGPCQGVSAQGCSNYGSQIWYCAITSNMCGCANTIFHEMSHGCGGNDRHDGGTYDAYRIGDWFEGQYATQFGCIGRN